jgi:hypothetical protein
MPEGFAVEIDDDGSPPLNGLGKVDDQGVPFLLCGLCNSEDSVKPVMELTISDSLD